jgi:hypothetical protein
MEEVFPIVFHIPSLKFTVQLLPEMIDLEELLAHLENLYEQHRDASLANEAHKCRLNWHYD